MNEISTCYNKVTSELCYSVRRYYVDLFFIRHICCFKQNASILDMGGLKGKKRGVFNIERYTFYIKYANIAEKANPDYLCDITHVPVENCCFDGVILAEVLEHVINPKAVLQEAYRILKPGGVALICTPFLLHVHADPYDFGRYTGHWYRTVMTDIGFINVEIEKQGFIFQCVSKYVEIVDV